MAANTTRPQYASTSLYVGDLSPEVTEATLYEFFNSVGPVASIKVCRDASSRRSLRYAYVNYHSVQDAERALETLNYTPIKGTCCRIMWSQRDPTARKSNQGNLFVKNLDKGVDNRALHDTFSLFGNILSCKVVTDEQGKSKGYGFVHFETDEAAQAAIERVNGMKIGSKEVYVAHHQKRTERPSGKAEHFTNLYSKDFPKSWTEDILKQVFGQFGEVTSVWLSSDAKGRPFACVNFEEASDAKKAMQELTGKYCDGHGIAADQDAAREAFLAAQEQQQQQDNLPDAQSVPPLDGNKLTDNNAKEASAAGQITQIFVDRAQDKSERHQTLRTKLERGQQYRNKYEGVNLYIKNLSDNVDDAVLRVMFEPFGTITSAKVMRDEDGHSKGFGFVCFTMGEEATKAIAEMHLKLNGGKPLYVGLAEQKDRRHARLQNHFRGSRQPPTAAAHQSGATGYSSGGYAPTAAAAAPPHGNYYVPPQATGAGGPGPMMNAWQHAPTAAAYPQPASGASQIMWKAPPPSAPYVQVPSAATGLTATGYPAARQFRRPAPGASNALQKQVLGEQLFPLVYQHQPTLAGKITGMMLDMEESELLVLIHSESELKAKIEEALRVLEKAHQ